MCGRYTLIAKPADIERAFGIGPPTPNPPPRYNIAPTQEAPVLRLARDEREIRSLRWGLVPTWAGGLDFTARPLINARAETVADKPSFRAAFKSRRCLVPADGYYEWKRVGRTKRPFRIHREDDGLFAFAGIWERWEGGEDPVESFAIITTAASGPLSAIHDRMPVIVASDRYADWLAAGSAELFQADTSALIAYRVSARLNSPSNDDPACVAALDPAAP